MNEDVMIPVGEQIMGRVLNSRGEPIDEQGPISNAPRMPIYSVVPSAKGREQVVPKQMFETGIKIIDLLAPIPHGGTIGMFASVGEGKLVTLEEVMHNILTHYSKYIIIFIGMDESTYEASELMEPVKNLGTRDRIVMLFEQMSDSPEVYQRLVRAGLTIANYYRDQEYEVLLIVDKNVTTGGSLVNMHELKQAGAEKVITTILLGSGNDYSRLETSNKLSTLDGHIVFSRKLARQNLWPAIDPLLSGSHLLDNGLVSPEHMQVAQQVRQILQRYYEILEKGDQGLSVEDQDLIKRAVRIQFFLTQPYSVAEAYTDIPGEYVRVDDTIKDFKELLDGRYDNLPEQAFYFVGTIDQALAKARTLM